MGIFGNRLRLLLILLLAGVIAASVLPAAAAAEAAPDLAGRESRADINIRSNEDFTAENGVRSGSGTAEDPYEISGWNVFRMYIADTDAHVIIHDNTVRSQMILNWIGRNAHVHHNDVSDLRVNQNVRRTGDATSGVIAENTFNVVGQLRHWDGVFEDNVVGSPPGGGVYNDLIYQYFGRGRAVNFDGFNGAQFRNNRIYGYMDARLHGHHHSSGWGEESHHHGYDEHMGRDGVDHTQRYHEVSITGNSIYVVPSSSYGLAYLDTNHAANDRTANSEENPALNDDHVHYTRVRIADNEIVGSGLRVNVFNANDQRHAETGTGRVELEGNNITLLPDGYQYTRKDGIYVNNARDVEMRIRGNFVHAERPLVDVGDLVFVNGAGIYLTTMDLATVCLTDNEVHSRRYGIQARSFSASVDWIIDGLVTHDVAQPVDYSSVQNAPHEGPHRACIDDAHDDDQDDGDGGGHDHG